MAIEVQTTQNVTIDYEPAGVGYRLLAYIIDWIVIGIWLLGWLGYFYFLAKQFGFNPFSMSDSAMILYAIIIGAPVLFYDLLFETLNNGQSLGKMLFKIRVVKTDGTEATFGAYLLRWLFRAVDFGMTEGILGILMIALTDKSQRLGDYIAGTTVIDLKMNKSNRELKVPELDFHQDYKVTYVDVLDKLSDRDIQTVLAIMGDDKMKENDFFTGRLADRIKQVTGYSYTGSDKAFLNKVVSDYNFLALQY